MQPQSPTQPAAPASFDPNTNQAKQQKLIRWIIILAVIGVIGAILLAIFSGPPKNNEVSAVLANQQEMLRIIDARRENLTSSETANFVSIVRPILVTQSRDLTGAGVGVQTTPNSASIDAQLDEATRSSQLDQELEELLVATMEQDLIVLKQVEPTTEDGDQLKPVLRSIIEDYSTLVADEE